MNTQQRAVVQQALEAFKGLYAIVEIAQEDIDCRFAWAEMPDAKEAINALRQLLEQEQAEEPVASMEALKDAFFEGFTSAETYNDTLLNSPEEAWLKYKPPTARPQPATCAGIDKETQTMKLMGLIDDLIEADPDRAERFIESILARHSLQKRLREKNAAQPADLNLACKSVQARLAAQWGYVKAEQADEPVAWGNLANWCLDSDRVLITDKTEAEKYHRDVYDLTPLYTRPQPTGDTLTPDEAQPEQADEPAAWAQFKAKADEVFGWVVGLGGYEEAVRALFNTRPQPAAWVGLTDEEFIDLCEDASNFGTGSLIRHIEQRLKEKNA